MTHRNPWRNRTFIDIDFDAKPLSMAKCSSHARKPTKALAIDVIYDSSDMKYLFSMYTHSPLQSHISWHCVERWASGMKGRESILASLLSLRVNLSNVSFASSGVSRKSEILWKFFQILSSINFIKDWNVSHFNIIFHLFSSLLAGGVVAWEKSRRCVRGL